MAYVVNAMRECRFSRDERQAYYNEATSGDYDHLLCVSIGMIDKCNEISDSTLYAKM